ncbi:MAG: hypothetical protein ABFC56_13665 [Clostridiaceae bacterium]
MTDKLETNSTLHLLPTSGEYPIVKTTKYGVYVLIGKSKVFLPNSVLTYEGKEEDKDDSQGGEK